MTKLSVYSDNLILTTERDYKRAQKSTGISCSNKNLLPSRRNMHFPLDSAH